MPPAERAALLRPLLHDLATRGASAPGAGSGWAITSIRGGWNGLVYRATSDLGDLAIKLTVQDERQRAAREYEALSALQEAGLAVAPDPLLLDLESQPLAAVVQSWLTGEVSASPPANDAEWLHLLHHLVQVHSVTPASIHTRLRPAVLTAESPAASRSLVCEQAGRMPEAAQPAEARALLRQLAAAQPLDPRRASLALCRCDSNTLNYVRRPSGWASVDWENSGWGDPAFEIAEMTTHPAFSEVTGERWEWVIRTYAQLTRDAASIPRIHAYRKVLAAWWVFRLLRYRYDAQHGNVQGLGRRPAGWRDQLPAQYERYLTLAQQLISAA